MSCATSLPQRNVLTIQSVLLLLVTQILCDDFGLTGNQFKMNSTDLYNVSHTHLTASILQTQYNTRPAGSVTSVQRHSTKGKYTESLVHFDTGSSTGTADSIPAVSPGPLAQHSVAKQTPLSDASFQTFHLFLDDCSGKEGDDVEFSAMQGEVLGFFSKRVEERVKATCQVKISVPEGYFMFVEFDFPGDWCSPYTVLVAYKLPSFWESDIGCARGKPNASFIPLDNFVHFRLEKHEGHRTNQSDFRVRFKATEMNLLWELNVVKTTAVSGYITSPGYDGRRLYPPLMQGMHTVDLPKKHTIMLSFEHLDLPFSTKCEDRLVIRHTDNGRVRSTCDQLKHAPVNIYSVPIEIVFMTDNDLQETGFKLYFTIQPSSKTPQRLKSGLFNCSVPYYTSFKQHVHCNMKQECEGGEDEGGHCPFSSPACNGSVAVNNKCYVLHLAQRISMEKISLPSSCTLGMMKTKEELEAFLLLFRSQNVIERRNVAIGLIGYELGMPQYYRRMFRWKDNTISFNINTLPLHRHTAQLQICQRFVPDICAYYDIRSPQDAIPIYCQWLSFEAVVCEFYVDQTREDTISRPIVSVTKPDIQRYRHFVVTCPAGHVTFNFLACHQKSSCGVLTSLQRCPFASPSAAPTHTFGGKVPAHRVDVPTFSCQDGNGTIPYSFVCDFWEDCRDRSDEDFCDHSRPCEGSKCRNGQCIELSQVCDTFLHCVDYSDEEECLVSRGHWAPRGTASVLPPAIINFTSSGYITHATMNAADACPDTHFRCQGQLDYCLPVYVLCNGVYDCLGHEDEAGCDQAELCPGFYRCWDSTVCLHPDHLCDGVFQCPRREDELFCGATCPDECQCQGHAFVCGGIFHTQPFPHLRYLDAAGSGIKPHSVLNHWYLIWTSMQSCGVSYLPVMHFPNLRFFDLSENLLTAVSVDVFVGMKNLEILSLAGNPLVSLLKATSVTRGNKLKQLDLTRTDLMTFDGEVLQYFPDIKVLNISNGKLAQIQDNGFHFASSLQKLDIRGNPIKEYPLDVLKGLSEIQYLYSSDFRFCCRAVLPNHYDAIVCQSPQDELSSCEDLLRSNTYRACLWVICVMSVLGNAGSFLLRCLTQRKVTKTGFSVFVTSLCLADLLMGVYLAMVGAADSLYRGQYLSYERSWTASAVCKTAGFLSLLSSEVSAIIIFLITLDRFIVLRFPFSSNKFRQKSALVASSIAWTAGFLLAAVPLLPVTSHWEFYGQSGICIPLPVTRKTFKGRDYSFGVMIILNCVLFIFIAAGQSVIYTSVRSNRIMTDTTKKSQDATIARRLLTVVVTDFACWFPIGLLGLLASAGVPIPGEVNVAVAIFVLPLNSALNPFLYTFNMLAEKRRKSLEVKLMKLLDARVVARETDTEYCAARDGSNNIPDDLTVEEAVTFLAKSLVSKATTWEKIKAVLGGDRNEETQSKEDESILLMS